MNIFALLLLVLFITSSSSLLITVQADDSSVQKRILKYNVEWTQTYFEGSSDKTNVSWAIWNDAVSSSGTTATTSTRDDAVQLTPLNVCPPFYNRLANRLFIDSNGFISFQPFSMCALFCFSSSNIGDLGYYDFRSDGSRGDWPLISGYLYDLDPSTGGTIRFLDKTNGTANFVEETTVEYDRIPPYRGHGSQGVLRLQIMIARNGTIVIRFRQVLTGSLFMTPATGTILSKEQREVLAPSLSSTNLSNWKLTPVADPCQIHDNTNCTGCINTSYSEGACVWCGASKQCVNTKVAKDVCAGTSDTFTNVTEGDCEKEYIQVEPKAVNNTVYQQVFYRNSINGRKRDTIGTASVYDVDFSTFTDAKKILNGSTEFPKSVSLPFNFSFFNFPNSTPSTAKGLENEKRWRSNEIRIYQSGLVKLTTDDATFPFSETCDPSGGFCSNANFPPSISPFSTVSVAVGENADGVDDASITQIELPERTPASSIADAKNSPFCDSTLAAANTEDPTKCAKAVGFEILFFRHRESLLRGAKRDIRVEMKVRVFIDAAGNLGFQLGRVAANWLPAGNCGEDESIAQFGSWVYPHPTIGLIRYGVTDYSSVALPMQAIGDEQVIAFSPIKGCPSCNQNGACNTSSFQCVCKSNYAGEDCSSCAAGYFGRFCDKCPACQNGGTCDDGDSGSGSCVCTGQFSGEFCEVDCGSAAAAQCSECSLFGGICTCGECACRKSDGWYGDSCSDWRDPCDRASLSGCRSCLDLQLSKGEQCFYCQDSGEQRCMSSSSRRRINASLLGNCGNQATSCQFSSYPRVLSLEYNGTLGIIAFVILAILTLTGVCALVCCRTTHVNPFIISAVPGVPDFRRPAREREVIQIRVVDSRRVGLLQGIPLKSIPILDLYRYQEARRQLGSDFNGENNSGPSGSIDTLEVPGREYIEERIQDAKDNALRWANAGPIPASPARREGSARRRPTTTTNTTAAATRNAPPATTNTSAVADANNSNSASATSLQQQQQQSAAAAAASGNEYNYAGVPNNNNTNNETPQRGNSDENQTVAEGEVNRRRHTPQEA